MIRPARILRILNALLFNLHLGVQIQIESVNLPLSDSQELYLLSATPNAGHKD